MKKTTKLLSYQQLKNGMKVYELIPVYDARNSFYGKALIIESSEGYILYSYMTPVMIITKNNKCCFNSDIDYDLLLSATTLRHIKDFIKQYLNSGYDFNKKDFESCLYNCIKKDSLKSVYDPSLQYLF